MIKLDQFTLTTIPLEQYFNDTLEERPSRALFSCRGRAYILGEWVCWSAFKGGL
jgi:hypothetical protein